MFSQQLFCYARCSQAARRRNVSRKFFSSLVVMSVCISTKRLLTSVQPRVASCIELLQIGIFQIQSHAAAARTSMRQLTSTRFRLLRLIWKSSSHDCADVQTNAE